MIQSEEARVEAKILMRVQEHILTPRYGGAVISTTITSRVLTYYQGLEH